MGEQEVLKALEIISKTVQSRRTLRNVNAGGCGWFAAYTKFYLDTLGIKSQFVHIDCWGDKWKSSKDLVLSIPDRDKCTSASHVILFVADKYYFDSTGWGTKVSYYRNKWGKNWVLFDMPAEFYIQNALINKPRQWNLCYNVQKCNPTLRRAIHKGFSKVIKENNSREEAAQLLAKLETVNQY